MCRRADPPEYERLKHGGHMHQPLGTQESSLERQDTRLNEVIIGGELWTPLSHKLPLKGTRNRTLPLQLGVLWALD